MRERVQWIAIVVALLGVVVTSLLAITALRQDKDFRQQDLSAQLAKLEERFSDTNPTLLKGRLDRFELQLQELSNIDDGKLRQRVDNLEDALAKAQTALEDARKQLQEREEIDLSALADIIVREHAEALRGPEGQAGLQGRAGQDGQSPVIDYDALVRRLAGDSRLRQSSGKTPSQSQNTNSANKVYGSGDCFAFDPSLGVAEATLAHGGGICVGGIPNLAIRHTNGCSFVSFTGDATENRPETVRPGGTLNFEVSGQRFAFTMGCQKHEDWRFVYPIRIYAQ